MRCRVRERRHDVWLAIEDNLLVFADNGINLPYAVAVNDSDGLVDVLARQIFAQTGRVVEKRGRYRVYAIPFRQVGDVEIPVSLPDGALAVIGIPEASVWFVRDKIGHPRRVGRTLALVNPVSIDNDIQRVVRGRKGFLRQLVAGGMHTAQHVEYLSEQLRCLGR